jgi:flagellar biosynthesis/type III secretory pathway M-ring protein FliF/YscJ
MTHLTDEQLTDYLSGASLPAIDDHLAACGVCRQEIASMRSSFQVFHHASMEWSERMQNAPSVRRAAPSWNWAAVWAVACVAVIAAVLLFGVLSRPMKTGVRSAASAASSDSDTAELSQDNQLLAAIDKELDSADLSPQKMYGISESVKAR